MVTMKKQTKLILAVVLLCCTTIASAATSKWPSKPPLLIVPSAAGSPPDIIARLIAQELAKGWNQQMTIYNKPGAGGVVGLSALKNAQKDGHTFALAQAATVSVAPHIAPTNLYDIDADFTPIALVAAGPMMLVAEKSFAGQTAGDFISMAKKATTAINVGVNGQNSMPHLTALALKRDASLNINIVPFSSSSGALTAVLNGDVQVLIDGIPGVTSMLQSKKIKALAVTSKNRLESEPAIPALSEFVPGMEANGWFVLFAQKSIDASIIEKLNHDIRLVAKNEQIRVRFSSLGVEPGNLSVDETIQFVAHERTRWESLIKAIKNEAQ